MSAIIETAIKIPTPIPAWNIPPTIEQAENNVATPARNTIFNICLFMSLFFYFFYSQFSFARTCHYRAI